MKKKKFYMVWNPARDAPKKRYESFKEAKRDANCLARKRPGERFFVLKSVSASGGPRMSVDPINIYVYVQDTASV